MAVYGPVHILPYERGLSQFYGPNPSLTERYFQKNNMKRSSYRKRIGSPTNMRWITIGVSIFHLSTILILYFGIIPTV
jgi:hypothetical protein